MEYPARKLGIDSARFRRWYSYHVAFGNRDRQNRRYCNYGFLKIPGHATSLSRKGMHMKKIRYRGAGLPNIWLVNGYKERKSPYGNTTAVENVKGLHRAIGNELVHSKQKLTGAEFRFLRKELGLSQKKFGDLIGLADQTVALWEKKGPVPAYADRFLRALYVEYNEGTVQLRELIDRINELDKQVKGESVFKDTPNGWKPQPKAA